MLFTKNNAWIMKMLFSDVKNKTRFCYVLDVIDINTGKIVLSDGMHFIHSVFIDDSYRRMTSEFSTQSLQLKGAILLLKRFNFAVNRKNKMEMNIEECIYFGEGSIGRDIVDVNVYLSRIGGDFKYENINKEEKVSKRLLIDQYTIGNTVNNSNSNSVGNTIGNTVNNNIIGNNVNNNTIGNTNNIKNNKNEKIEKSPSKKQKGQKNEKSPVKKRSKELITESFIATFSKDSNPSENSKVESFDVIDCNGNLSQYIKQSCSLPSSIIEKFLFHESSQTVIETDSDDYIKESFGRSILSDITNRRTDSQSSSKSSYIVKFCIDDGSFDVKNHFIKRYEDSLKVGKTILTKVVEEPCQVPNRKFLISSLEEKPCHVPNRKFLISSLEEKSCHVPNRKSTFSILEDPKFKKFIPNEKLFKIPVIKIRSVFKNDLFKNRTVVKDEFCPISFIKKSNKRYEKHEPISKFKLPVIHNSIPVTDDEFSLLDGFADSSICLNSIDVSDEQNYDESSFSDSKVDLSFDSKADLPIDSSINPSIVSKVGLPIDSSINPSIISNINPSIISKIDFSQQSVFFIDYTHFIDLKFYNDDDSVSYPVFYYETDS